MATPPINTTNAPETHSPCERLVQWLSTGLPCMRPADNSLFAYQKKLANKEQITQLKDEGKARQSP